MASLSVEMVPIDRLKPMPDNPRRISEAGLRKLVGSLQTFGWTNPILAQRGTDMVIAGHQRLRAAREAGIETVPVIYLDFDDAQARAYALADNRIAEETQWDEELLAGILRELEGQIDLSLTGFDDGEIERILTEAPDVTMDFDPEESESKGLKRYEFILTPEQFEKVDEVIQRLIDNGYGVHPDNPHKEGNALYYLVTHAADVL